MKKQITKSNLVIKISTNEEKSTPYFSITGELYEEGKSKIERNLIACGCIHEDILEVAPELKALVDLHLSDLDGVPIHAEENGWFWLAKASGVPQPYEPSQDSNKCFKFFCQHARLSTEDAQEVVDRVKRNPVRGREMWGKYLDGLRPVWHDQAQKAIELIKSL